MTQKLLILAKDAHEAARFLNDYNIPIASAIYVRDNTVLRGYRDNAYVILPEFWKRSDCLTVYTSLQRTIQQGKVLPLPLDMDPNMHQNRMPTIPTDSILVKRDVYNALEETARVIQEKYEALSKAVAEKSASSVIDRLGEGDIAPSGIKRIRGAKPLSHKIKKIAATSEYDG